MMSKSKHKKGFTLIEVLVAMVILSLSLLAAIKVASGVTRSAIDLQEITIAQWVAMNKIVELRLAKSLLKTGRTNGRDEMAGREWRWDIIVNETPYPKLREVRVEVKPDADGADAPPTTSVVSLIGEL
ncbi:hypothetical protein MNBD_GAMMA21-1449 [hydrothermal vent metagenome]|uniref:Type II secretion system protein GspI C-terminal domain-containing protein n=1 Tax=hydrothermal vent metagenome TaxID=652676 RepID=A0A3B1A179_9ZZZZ